jgi:hypothetical protein
MQQNVLTKDRQRVKVQGDEAVKLETEISKVGIVVIAAMSGVIGIWGVSCFVGGVISSEGPLNFVSSWVKALTQM